MNAARPISVALFVAAVSSTARATQVPPIPLSTGTPMATTHPATAPATAPTTTPTTEPTAGDDLPYSVVLGSGERVTGRIVSRDAQQIVIASDALGVVTVSSAKIAQVIGPDGKPETAAQTAAANVDGGLLGTGLFRDWTRQLEAGLNGAAGTTDSNAFDVQLNAGIDNDRYRATFGAWYFFTKTDDATDRNETRVFATVDKRINGGPWFVFGRTQYDNDSLQTWENRASVFAGPGYEFIKNDHVELLGRVGLGYTKEFGGLYPDGYQSGRFEALVGVDYKWIIDPTQSIVASCYLTPSLDDLNSQGRVVTNIAYQLDLSTAKGWGLKLGVEHDYDFRTPGPDEHNNYKYFVNLLMKL